MLSGRLLEWGNSYGIRLRRADVENTGLAPGADYVIRVKEGNGRVDLSHVHFIKGGRPEDSKHLDKLISEASWQHHLRKVGRARR